MAYILKQYDMELMRFALQEDVISGLSAQILSIAEDKRYLLPLDLAPTESGLLRWLKNRTIPSNRAYVHSFLAKLGASPKDTRKILDICRGLSLNDSYWIVPESFTGTFRQNNLYENRFSRILGEIAFTGYGSYRHSQFCSSPELTTNGMLPKSWRRINGKILLYKAGTTGFANSGNEPYSEYYAYQVAKKMGLQAVPYNLARWKGQLCSTCVLFTDINTSFIPIGRLVPSGGMGAIMAYYKKLGEDYYNALVDMLIFDAVVCNTDRHFGNFGLLAENQGNTPIAPAPVFDHGLSLFYSAMPPDLNDLEGFAKTQEPVAYADHVEFAKQFISGRQRSMVRRLLDFRFTRHGRYNLPQERLQAIEGFIHQRASILLNL